MRLVRYAIQSHWEAQLRSRLDPISLLPLCVAARPQPARQSSPGPARRERRASARPARRFCGAGGRDRENADMAGPSWLAGLLAVAMIATAMYCTGRLAAARLWRRSTEIEADSVHVVMGVAMAGMLLPRLSPLPATAWEAVFGAAAVWFACQAIRNRLRRNADSRWRGSHPVPHLVESAAMVYMLAVLPGSWPGWPGQAMTMPGMSGSRAAAGGSLLALAIILALFMIGYVLWTADQLTALVRTPAAAAPEAVQDQAGTPDTAAVPASAAGMLDAPGAAGAVLPGQTHWPGGPALAPRLAACYKIAMGLTMGYMLILML